MTVDVTGDWKFDENYSRTAFHIKHGLSVLWVTRFGVSDPNYLQKNNRYIRSSDINFEVGSFKPWSWRSIKMHLQT